jgi:hypothetical protein
VSAEVLGEDLVAGVPEPVAGAQHFFPIRTVAV